MYKFVCTVIILFVCHSVLCTKTGSWKYTSVLADLIWALEKVQIGVTSCNRLQNPTDWAYISTTTYNFSFRSEAEENKSKIKKFQKVNKFYTLHNSVYSGHSCENNSWIWSHVSSEDRCQPNNTENFTAFVLRKLKGDLMLGRRTWRLFDKIPLNWADSKVRS